jgi:hypothetical protein
MAYQQDLMVDQDPLVPVGSVDLEDQPVQTVVPEKVGQEVLLDHKASEEQLDKRVCKYWCFSAFIIINILEATALPLQ